MNDAQLKKVNKRGIKNITQIKKKIKLYNIDYEHYVWIEFSVELPDNVVNFKD